MLTAGAEAESDGPAPEVEAPGSPRHAPEVTKVPPLVVTAPALLHLPAAPRRTLFGWIAASLLVHAAVLILYVGHEASPVAVGEMEIPIEIVMEPLEVSAEASPAPVQEEQPPAAEAPAMAELEPPPAPVEPPQPASDEPLQARAPPAPAVEAEPPAVAVAPAKPPEVPPAEVVEPAPPLPPSRPAARPAPAKVREAPVVREHPRAAPPARTERHAVQAPAAAASPRSSASDISNWQSLVVGRLRAAMHYPDAARAQGITGRATVTFALDAGGRVTSASLVHSSGNAALDAEAGALVRRASPFPPPPPGGPRSLTVPINFSLR